MKLANALLLVEQFRKCSSLHEVGTAFAGMIAPHGFMMVSCGESSETPSGRAWKFFFNTWPADLLLEYQKNDYVRYDVMPTAARLSSTPFTWQELLRDRKQTPKQIEFNDWVRSRGVADGYAVPIHLPGGDVGLCVSVSDHLVEDTEERLALHMASLYAYDRCQALGRPDLASSVKAQLSPRELECLKWVLDGKSDTDIGAILGISRNTAHFHIERVKKKLGVRTRTQAAAMIVTMGYL
jgi:LuxR family transcriptional regulator, quorum-sensing system regulator BjaR1